MKALSVRQPWAWLIVQGIKNIENRTWATDLRGYILIHAGKARPDPDDLDRAKAMLRRLGLKVTLPETLDLGAIVGSVEITGMMTDKDVRWYNRRRFPWYEGPVGWTLANPIAFDQPLPYKGKLGLFEVEIEAVPGLEEALRQDGV